MCIPMLRWMAESMGGRTFEMEIAPEDCGKKPNKMQNNKILKQGYILIKDIQSIVGWAGVEWSRKNVGRRRYRAWVCVP